MGNKETGLTAEEAKNRLEKYGKNQLTGKKREPLLRRFFRQFKDFSVLVLLFAAVLSCIVGVRDGEADFGEALIILLVLVVNAVFGVVQEARAEHAIEALKKLSAPVARVIRDGKEQTVDAVEITVGDLLVLSAGDYIPADGKLIAAVAMRTDETALTGESEPVEKKIGDNVYAGTLTVNGGGKMLVEKIGMQTNIGSIAAMLEHHGDTATPLQQRLDHTGKVLGIGALFICGVVFLLGLLAKMEVLTIFMTSVSLAVAAIPEGLPATVTVVLAMGVTKMAKHRAILRKLPAVETLGSVSVICTDKTGTMTENRMRVVLTEGESEARLLEKAAICSHATKDNGDPTEQALLRALPGNFTRPHILREIPFDSDRKRMSVVVKRGGKYHTVVKGALEALLPLCEGYRSGEKELPLTEIGKNRLLKRGEALASEGLRVLAVADKIIPSVGEPPEQRLVFCGLIAMRDPLRKGVKEAVKTCKKAGIRTVMITGDHPATAAAIAKAAGLEPVVMTGAELSAADTRTLAERIKAVNVFARVTPAHKLKLIEAYKATGAVVAMTGDGVNDAPALRAASIGVAMGKGGTEVAREAADMILTDDNFATIVEAVRLGRGVYANIQKAIRFLLSSNIGELLTIFIALLFRWPAPLAAVQLLWINLVTDSLPAIALGMEPTEEDVLTLPPIQQEEGFFAHGVGARIITEGLLIGITALVTYYSTFLYYGYAVASTMTFQVLSISQLVHAFTVRSERPFWRAGFNKHLWFAFPICLVLQVGVVLLPMLNTLFSVVPLTLTQWGYVILMALLPFAVSEIEKIIARNN